MFQNVVSYRIIDGSLQCTARKNQTVGCWSKFLRTWGIRHPQSLHIQYFLQNSHEEWTQLVLASLCKTDSNKSWLLNRTYCSSEFTRIVNKTLIHIVIWPIRLINHVWDKLYKLFLPGLLVYFVKKKEHQVGLVGFKIYSIIY